MLVELFPVLEGVGVTHTWGGVLGVPRDWFLSVGLDRSTGLAWAGGYVGDRVGTANLAGRTLADLITGADTELVRLPWVGHRWRRWEPEPLRWLGINAALRLAVAADAEERRTNRPLPPRHDRHRPPHRPMSAVGSIDGRFKVVPVGNRTAVSSHTIYDDRVQCRK